MNTTQTDIFPTERKTTNSKPKTYTVQKYRLSYVKENSSLNRVRIINRNDVAEFCKQYLSPLPIEKVCIIALDSGNNIIGYEALEGATNQCAIYPSNIFRFLLSSGAVSFILSHNHPGHNPNASDADWQITGRLKKIGELLDLPLLDHILITETECISLRENSRWNQY